MKRIAIIEDDLAIRENYRDVMIRHGYQVDGYQDREQAIQAFTIQLPDLAIIDVGLGHEYDGGFLLCQQLRQLSATVPIIFLTARDNDFDTISGLRLGADDYLSKEIGLEHLMVRISALFRRASLHESVPLTESSVVIRGALIIDNDKMQVSWNETLLDVTITEFWIIHALANKPSMVRSRQQLMNEANMLVDDNTITSHIKRIRKKFIQIDPGFDEIKAIYGMGYRWDVSTESVK
ncbi:proteobacterial dedicated sortase system response regulator [Psychromonas sp. 14N.309.X.WAT.B.A12]|jgi:two-component system, OmpR family, response regulator|uniref:proteobacterial dedicated sortase system response regulator n=1 Tax=unclassified Psychromonas TaxID=2614957 RepID=UPI0025B1F38E|nr:proteobacterial dedicated sortase system response regulator [Psychromonas sp. 14N.309.X.WAT.B.A12]MDN2663257.1 proteobacterial dedicated sortase system response regulator [Psychromonas sp. 14N.309.X.WAT.B.A12]